MITRTDLEKINLQAVPYGQMLVANFLLRWDYRIPRKTEIIIEGEERIPRDQPVIFAMNHTDFYNYWPFMYQLFLNRDDCYISVWVKGKYFQNPLLKRFLTLANNIPIPSLGYVLTMDFQAEMGRKPTGVEYRLLRDWSDGEISQDEFLEQADSSLAAFVTTARSGFDPARESYAKRINAQYHELMRLVAKISEDALFNKNLNLLIFPQGTRSVQLLPGHIGVAQIALKTKVPVIPVGCNGCDKCYRGSLPFSSGGKIVYRVGEPLTVAGRLAPFAIEQPYEPFTRAADQAFATNFRGATDLIMDQINALLDPEYQFDPNAVQKTGVERFV